MKKRAFIRGIATLLIGILMCNSIQVNASGYMESDYLYQEDTERITENKTWEGVDEDPQSSTSMSNQEMHPGGGTMFRSRSYTGGTYVHNGRYGTGYKIINGIDVSYHNRTINWNAVKSSGIDYAMIRVGYRGYGSGNLNEDVKFRENIQGALNAGLKVGVYFFSQAITRTEAVEEAEYVLKRISGYNITLPVVIDFEYASGNTGRLYQANLSRDKATSICRNFCRTVEEAGYKAMVYANKSMLENNLDAGNLSSMYKIWLAHYTTKTNYSGAYDVWQYTSKGSVNGVSGNVDCNFFYEKNSVNLAGAQTYVRRLYKELLGRDADAGGLNSHSNAIANGTATASGVALTIIESAEFTNKKNTNQEYVSKLYRALLNRNAGASEVTYWTSQMDTGVSRRYVLRMLAGSEEFSNICNGFQIPKGEIQVVENRDKNYNVTAYVARCYQNILGRKADTSGLNTWSGKILSGNGGTEIVKDLIVSTEFTNKKKTDAEFIDILYKSMLGRNADAKGKSDWMNCLDAGVSRVYIINGFAGSKEFQNMCATYGIKAGTASITEPRDRNIGVTRFVNRLYDTILGRKGEIEGVNNWCNVITNKQMTPSQVAYEFVFSKEFTNKKLNNSDFIEILYKAFLGRNSDSAGKRDWMNILNSGKAREEVFWGFANSAEFRSIIAGYGL